MRLGIRLKESILRVSELFGKGSESFIVKESAIRLHFQEFGIGALVGNDLEIRIVKDQPLWGP